MPSKPTPAGFTARHYCQGIGDCHLLRFPKADRSPFWMLIDCGVHTSISGGSDLMDGIVEDIHAATGGRIDVLVLTHEHADHISAFLPSANRFADFRIGEIWMAWTESDVDPQAQALDKFKQQALTALADASQRLNAARELSPSLQALRAGVDALLGFSFGAKGEKVRALRKAAEALSPDNIRYREPGEPPITIRGLPNLRIYVLAPSRDERYLRITEGTGETYRMADDADGLRMARALSCAFAATAEGSAPNDPAAPFDASTGARLSDLQRPAPASSRKNSIEAFARDHYFGPAIAPGPAIRSRRPASPDTLNERDQSWRRIDHDWLGTSADLAMQLDNKTNNTSLVLAFELVDTGRVFLFAADAQVGNWLSWHDTRWTLENGDVVTGPALLARTVYYKVGHHGSHNATLGKKGLELMVSKDLSAFIPTNEDDAKNVHWGEMPFEGVLSALEKHCGKRVIRADAAWLLGGKRPFRVPSGSIRNLRTGPGVAEDGDPRRRWVEVDLA